MKLRLLIPLLICALSLVGCYRQTEEPFQQVDSAAVVSVSTPTSLAEVIDGAGDVAEGEPDVTRQPYITPETVPGQVEQPTPELPTPVPALDLTDAPLSVTRFVRPSPTLNFEELLDPNDPCVYTILSGDNLFRLSLSWNTTIQDIMDLNQMESDALAIGQLLLIPGCESPEPEATATDAPSAEDAPTEAGASDAVDTAGDAAEAATATPETEAVLEDTPTPGPRIHVVSSGDTLESISLLYRADVNLIIQVNELSDPDRLSVGQELLIPG